MWPFRRKRAEPAVIEVTLVDSASGAEFARSNMPLEQLPDTFEIATTLEIAARRWSVVSAVPSTKAEIAANGKVRILLELVLTVDPRELLFSLPTISDDLPPIDPKAELREPILSVRGDDWRGIEFVSSEFREVVDRELASVRLVWDERGSSGGFERCHARSGLERALGTRPLEIARIAEQLALKPLGGLASDDALGRRGAVVGGFGYRTPGGTAVYGTIENGRMHEFAVADPRGPLTFVKEGRVPIDLGADARGFLALARDLGLLLVDWRAAQLLGDRESR